MVTTDLISSSSSSSSSNTASNIGTGFGWFKQIINSNIEFKTLIAGSTKLGVTNNANDLTLDIIEANLSLSNIGGSVTTGQVPQLPHSKIGTNLILSETGLTAIRTVTFPDSTGTAVYSTDSRLSDSRVPTAHATTHSSGGSDPVTLSNLAGTISDSQISTSTLTSSNTKTVTNKTIDVQGPNFIKNVTEYMYIVWFDGTNYNALNTHTGNIDSVNTDAWTVINYAVNTGANGNGAVFIKKGYYPLSQSLKPVSNSVIKGEGWQQTQLRANGNYPAIMFDTSVTTCEVEDFYFSTAQTGYSSNIIQFNNHANANSIRRCIWYDFGVASGNAIGFINTGAANSATGIIDNTFYDCQITGFVNAIYMQIVNASTTLPIDVNGNWINSNNFYDLTVNAPTKRFLYCDGASGSVMDANNFHNSWMEASGVTDCAFFYDDGPSFAIHPSHKYVFHSGISVWDLPGGTHYANVNDSTFITFIGCIGDSNIGGSATTTQQNTNLQHISSMYNTDNFIQTLNNKALNATSITNSGLTTLQPTAAGGFESILTSSISTSTDTLRIDNGYGVSGVFAPIIRATLTSTNANSAMIPLYFQGIIAPANDNGNTATIVFGGMRSGQVALSSRPIIDFQNQFNSILTIYPTYNDFHNNEIRNAVQYADKNTLSGVVQDPIVKRTGRAQSATFSGAATASNIVTLIGALANYTPTGVGTNSQTWDSVEGLVMNWASTTTANQNIGLVPPSGGNGIARLAFATRVRIRSKIDTVAGNVARLYFGFSSASTLPTSDTPLANTDSGVLVGFRSTDANYTIFTNGGATALTATGLSTPKAIDTAFHTIEINWVAGATSVNVIVDDVSTTVSATLPATATNLFFYTVAQNATAVVRTHTVKGVWFETTN